MTAVQDERWFSEDPRARSNGVDGSAGRPGERLPAAELGASGATQAASREVLIVEDELTLRRIIARNLISRGVIVREAGSAQEALRSAIENPPDLLLLDLNLPDRSGWDVLRELRRRGVEVPTIVVSAVQVSADRLREFRPICYLPKPFPIESLLRQVLGAGVRTDEHHTAVPAGHAGA